MSFLASGASFLGRKFVPRHIKSDEGLFWKSTWQDCNIFSILLISGVTMAILLTTRGWLAYKSIRGWRPYINEKYTAFPSFLFGKRLKSQTVKTEL